MLKQSAFTEKAKAASWDYFYTEMALDSEKDGNDWNDIIYEMRPELIFDVSSKTLYFVVCGKRLPETSRFCHGLHAHAGTVMTTSELMAKVLEPYEDLRQAADELASAYLDWMSDDRL